MSTLRADILLLLAMLTFIGCSTTHPLTLSYYSRNLVLGKDNVLKIDGQPVNLSHLRQELVSRTINEGTSIVLHVHQNVPVELFDAIVQSLKAEGFLNLSFRVFKD